MNQDIENQEALIKAMKIKMARLRESHQEFWENLIGYIPTSIVVDRSGNESTEGVQYNVLDDKIIAYRLTGDLRNDGKWQIGNADCFQKFVIDDAEKWAQRDARELPEELWDGDSIILEKTATRADAAEAD